MSAGRVRLARQFNEAHRHQYSVQVMCELREVAPRALSNLDEASETCSRHRA
jgi:hypothetical protein